MVGWIGRKLDSLIGAAAAAVTALAASQFLAFVQQYIQRLGGHLDEALRTQAQIAAGETATSLAPVARQQLVDELGGRVAFLRQGEVALNQAGFLERPFILLRHLDPEIAWATLAEFQPALPLDAGSLVYGGIGLLLGWLFWELVKLPLRLLLLPAPR